MSQQNLPPPPGDRLVQKDEPSDLSEDEVMALAEDIWQRTRAPYYLAHYSRLDVMLADPLDSTAAQRQIEEVRKTESAQFRRQAALVAWAAIICAQEKNNVDLWRCAVMAKAGLEPMSEIDHARYNQEVHETVGFLARLDIKGHVDPVASSCDRQRSKNHH